MTIDRTIACHSVTLHEWDIKILTPFIPLNNFSNPSLRTLYRRFTQQINQRRQSKQVSVPGISSASIRVCVSVNSWIIFKQIWSLLYERSAGAFGNRQVLQYCGYHDKILFQDILDKLRWSLNFIFFRQIVVTLTEQLRDDVRISVSFRFRWNHN